MRSTHNTILIVILAAAILLSCGNNNEEVFNGIFSKNGSLATIITSPVTSVTGNTAVTGGSLTDDGSSFLIAKGLCWGTDQNPDITNDKTENGKEPGEFSDTLTGLLKGRTYYLRAYGINSIGVAYGNEESFTTLNTPTITTSLTTSITDLTAVSGGNITLDGGANVTTRGVCWSNIVNATTADSVISSGNGTGAFTCTITGLSPNTIYYVKAFATNSVGTAYGNEITFTTTAPGETVTDIDGNVYNTVTIGTQIWMKENLKTTRYRDGTAVPNITDNTTWFGLTSGAYSWYNNDMATYKASYGALYNFYATVDNRYLCPSGWHIPTNAEWTTLTSYLGGTTLAAGKLKETGTAHWSSPNSGATNESGFTALPGGWRANNWYMNLGGNGNWWSSTETSSTESYNRGIDYSSIIVTWGIAQKQNGYSVRCLKGEGQTVAEIPVVTTAAATSISQTTVISGGTIWNNGGAAITASGVCWSTSIDPTITLTTKTADTPAAGVFQSSISGLTPGTMYYVRAYATNSAGTAYGNQFSFTTNPANGGTITDIEGNVYNTVVIGTQTWMKENLKTTKYQDGTAIPNIIDNTEWAAQTTGVYCWLNDNISNKNIYGALYNHYTVTDSNNLCPTGWHIPSDIEWTTLNTFLGGSTISGGKLKAVSVWTSPNTGADNSSGFTALPSGYRRLSNFCCSGDYGFWWTSNAFDPTTAIGYRLDYQSIETLYYKEDKRVAFSVRCIKDNK
jgi:uncharacterized protein (TIGR02145 family)